MTETGDQFTRRLERQKKERPLNNPKPSVSKAAAESVALPAQRTGEKRPDIALPKGTAEVSPAGALANPAEIPPTITDSEKSEVGSAAALDTERELVRATCRIQLDLLELCVTPEAREAHKKRTCGGAEGGCPTCAANKTLREIRRDCARVANVALRLRWAADAELIDRFWLAHGRAPKGREWEDTDMTQAIERVTRGMPPARREVLLKECARESKATETRGAKRVLYPYPLLRSVAPNVSAGIISAVDQAVMQKWNSERWAALVQMDRSPAHFGWENPIPLRKADVVLKHSGARRFTLAFSVSSRSGSSARGKEFCIPIEAKDAYQLEILTTLAGDSAKLGACQISEDRKRPGKWYVRMAYRKLAERSTATKSAAINKGILTFLAAVTESGERFLYDGADIESYLKQVQARRQRYQRQVRVSNRVGHGRTRTIRPIEHLQGQGEAWRDTRCQTIARRFVKWLVAEGVGRLYIDDFSGIRDQPPEGLLRGEWIWQRVQEWPFFKLQMKIISCCEEVGIETVVRNPKHISGTCPKCGARSVKYANRKLRCDDCKHVDHWDVAAAKINLRDGERERRGEKEIEPKKVKGKVKKDKPSKPKQ